ncbi:MAG: Fe(3+) ABC transporter substrate-binding protein [Lautropia sp.]|nr:Fe(3+) ABC transporter substrate-binding protein [Lautropia sp.]
MTAARFKVGLLATAVSATLVGAVQAQNNSADDKVLNLYSARHYQGDERLYNDFTRQTGIKINRVELKDQPLLERLKSEGDKSPADVILLVDASRLYHAQQEGLFQPVQSKTLDERIPAEFRAQDGSWYGLSNRARVIVYNKDTVDPKDVMTYESLADPKNKGKVCTRSGSHPYNLSLFGSMIEHDGLEKTEKVLKGYVDNQARTPKGGDTDQIKAVASGECGVALTNSYYLARMMRSDKPEDKVAVARIGMVWPNQATTGTHMNLAGGAVAAHAPHRDNAIRFLEYLSSDQAQKYFADGNNEWPIVKSVKVPNPALDALGSFKMDSVSTDRMAAQAVEAQKLLDKVGYK